MGGLTLKKQFLTGVFTFLLCIAISCVAFSLNLDPVDIVKGIERHYRKNCPFEAVFTQEVYSPGSILPSMKAKGKFLYAGRYMKWEYSAPEKQIFVVLPGVCWMYLPEDKQLQVFGPDFFRKSPIYAAFSEGILKVFRIRSVSRYFAGGSTEEKLVHLALEARDKNSDIKNLTLIVDIESKRISRIESLDIVGRKNVLVFSEEKHLKRVNRKAFSLPGLDDVTIIDSEGNVIKSEDLSKLIKSSGLKEFCDR